MTLSGDGRDAPKLVQAAAEQIGKLNKFTPEEIRRAKNMLKSNMFASSENGKAVAEDTGRQILMSGSYTSPQEFARQIDAVTEADLVGLAERMVSHPLTMVVYGNTTHAPHLTQVQKLFDKKSKK
jgi:processing peptidase subunit alpha